MLIVLTVAQPNNSVLRTEFKDTCGRSAKSFRQGPLPERLLGNIGHIPPYSYYRVRSSGLNYSSLRPVFHLIMQVPWPRHNHVAALRTLW